jgi:hypothetical protein
VVALALAAPALAPPALAPPALAPPALAAPARAAPSGAPGPPPGVRLLYAEPFDGVCTRKTGFKIAPAWRRELDGRMPELRAAWRRVWPALARTTERLGGRRFHKREFDVALTLCSFGPMSLPLLVNVRPWLRSAEERPRPTALVLGTTYHEILHWYLDEADLGQTPLLARYRREHPAVRVHLHLLSLLKAVYLELGWKRQLEIVLYNDRRIPGGHYRRAWEIVNTGRNHEAFVRELRAAGRRRPRSGSGAARSR